MYCVRGTTNSGSRWGNWARWRLKACLSGLIQLPIGIRPEQVDFPFGSDFQAEFDGADPARAAADYARLTEEIKHADAAASNASLDETFTSNGEVMSLRMIYLHMIEEYARHLGHADLLREQIDGVTGE